MSKWFVGLVVVGLGMFLINKKSSAPNSAPTQDEKIAAHEPQPEKSARTPTTPTQISIDAQTSYAENEAQSSPADHPDADPEQQQLPDATQFSVKQASLKAAQSAPPSWNEFLNAKSIGMTRDSDLQKDPSQFVGFLEAPNEETGAKFVSLNYDRGSKKWAFCGYPTIRKLGLFSIPTDTAFS